MGVGLGSGVGVAETGGGVTVAGKVAARGIGTGVTVRVATTWGWCGVGVKAGVGTAGWLALPPQAANKTIMPDRSQNKTATRRLSRFMGTKKTSLLQQQCHGPIVVNLHLHPRRKDACSCGEA
ncbi:MAG: hypothetical protein Fur0021_10920 [Candidatus Promineifilaceae bacterium]